MSSPPGVSSLKDDPAATLSAFPEAATTSASGTLGSIEMALVTGCCALWGVFPLYFHLLSATGGVEIIGYRIFWTLVSCLMPIALRRHRAQLVRAVRSPRLLGMLAVCGLLVSANRLVYVYGVNSARTTDVALSYFISPLVTVALASLVLHKRLRPAHRVSIALVSAGVTLLVALQGLLPRISLALAFSFTLCGLIKKQLGPDADALTGPTVESAVVTPVALTCLGHLAWQEQSVWQAPGQGRWILALPVVADPATAVLLLLFAAGIRRVSLSVAGMGQYIAPTIQFLLAWGASHERIPPARWTAMILVWAAITVLIDDAVRQFLRHPCPR